MKLAFGTFAVTCAVAATAPFAVAAPYASGVTITGTTVNFVLNEGGSNLSYSINGGPAVALDGTAKGAKTFALGSATDTFSITATKLDSVGYTGKTGATVATSGSGFSQPTAAAGFKLISTDADTLVKFNSPRGVAVQTNPNQGTFGTAYVSNSAVATTGRIVGDGLYAVKADQSDAFNYGNTAQTGGLNFTGSTNSPYRITAGSDGRIYIADFSDASGQVAQMSANLSSGGLILPDVGGPTALPAGRNHGSTSSVIPVFGPTGLTLYTLDEDLTTNFVTGAGSTTDRNSVWKYSIGTSAEPYTGLPTKAAGGLILGPSFVDLDVGADGKFYMTQGRSAGAEPGLIVADSTGTVVFNSLTVSRTLLSNPTAADILTNVNGAALSPDQKFLAVVLNNNGIGILPLIDGVPDLANLTEVAGTVGTVSGRDISFDAAGNIYYVSSGQALLRVISPGGYQTSTLSYDGTGYSFAKFQVVPEPTTLAAMAGLGMFAIVRRRKA